MTLESFTHTASTAVSVVNIQNTFRVTQNYHPSAQTPNLYEATVTIENISGHALADVRYRRVMDWDIEPTAFNEFVTINGGNASELLFDSNNGFADREPARAAHATAGTPGNFTDVGPADHGALFDFGLRPPRGRRQHDVPHLLRRRGDRGDALHGDQRRRRRGLLARPAEHARRPDARDAEHLHLRVRRRRGAAIFSPNAADDTLTHGRRTRRHRERARERHRSERRHAHRHDARTQRQRTAPSRARPPGSAHTRRAGATSAPTCSTTRSRTATAGPTRRR